MTTELAVHETAGDLAAQMDYAKAAAVSDLLPQAYRGKPANVLIAVGLGQAMGLSPAESLYRIDVIQGKPTASAELIAANVRRAGHKLRVRVDEQATSATATIVRADDPDYEHTVTRDMAWAQQMGLATKDNYKKQPTTMLQWRAISAVARQACPEALYGVAYTPDELQEGGGNFEAAAPVPRATAAQFTAPTTTSHPDAADDATPVVDAIADDPGDVMTARSRGEMFALFDQKGADTREKQLKAIKHYAGVDVDSRGDLTEQQALDVINGLRKLKDAEKPAPEDIPDDEFAGLAGGEEG